MDAPEQSDSERADVSVVIATFMREQVLIDTINCVLTQCPPAKEILVIDQSPSHDSETESQLTSWSESGKIRWTKLSKPSITRAMNYGLQAAKGSIVLFLDDDVTASSDLVCSHAKEYCAWPGAVAVVGQVLQPGEIPRDVSHGVDRSGIRADFAFPFYSKTPDWVNNVIACNLSVSRQFALAAGGFDEKFIGVAYRFETEFAHRLTRLGGRIRFCPGASINHLRASRGGTRSTGSHLCSADPKHGIGDYYFCFMFDSRLQAWRYAIARLFREVRTRFHLFHPWWIPVKLVGEIRAMWGGWKLARAKRREVRGARNEEAENAVRRS